ncbi:MAG: hypothetical protein NZ530_04210 [Thermodesulfobacteriaceae bacterium]|nr:hypothetical protein [Thermodesulfobacteriaceae bacterium]
MGIVERFNRMLEEEFIEYREWLLKEDVEGFNRELMKYLIRYNVWRGCIEGLEMYRLSSGLVTNFTRIPLSLKSYGLIYFLVFFLL